MYTIAVLNILNEIAAEWNTYCLNKMDANYYFYNISISTIDRLFAYICLVVSKISSIYVKHNWPIRNTNHGERRNQRIRIGQ